MKFGNELTPLSVKDEPTVQWSAEEKEYYTLIMTGPDAPSRAEPTYGQIKHWMVVNIPGTDLMKGETLADYKGSCPSIGSGFHRYIFLVYKQHGYLRHSEITVPPHSLEGRINFNVRDFAKKYDFGQPVAFNFYLAQSDEYSRELMKKWTNEQNQELGKNYDLDLSASQPVSANLYYDLSDAQLRKFMKKWMTKLNKIKQ